MVRYKKLGSNISKRRLSFMRRKKAAIDAAVESGTNEPVIVDYLSRLIHEIRKRPAIWDVENAMHNDQEFLASQWRELARIFYKTPKEVEQNWNYSVLGNFRRHCHNLLLQYGSNCNIEECADSVSWPYFKLVYFLNTIVRNEYISSRTSSTCKKRSAPPKNLNSTRAIGQQGDGTNKVVQDKQPDNPASSCLKTTKQPPNKRKCVANLDSLLPSLVNEFQDTGEELQPASLSPNAVFGKFVTDLLDQMSPDLQLNCQEVISETLFSALRDGKINVPCFSPNEKTNCV